MWTARMLNHVQQKQHCCVAFQYEMSGEYLFQDNAEKVRGGALEEGRAGKKKIEAWLFSTKGENAGTGS
jgi:hypothetical protein